MVANIEDTQQASDHNHNRVNIDHLMQIARRDRRLFPNSVRLLGAIGEHQQMARGWILLTIRKWAEEAGMSRGDLQDTLEQLKNYGYIDIERKAAKNQKLSYKVQLRYNNIKELGHLRQLRNPEEMYVQDQQPQRQLQLFDGEIYDGEIVPATITMHNDESDSISDLIRRASHLGKKAQIIINLN